MKIAKTLPIFLFIIFLSGFVSANIVVTYNFVDSKTNTPLTDVDALVMTCGDALCTESTIKTPKFPNTGNSNDVAPNNDIIISYPTIQETPYGYAYYFYKSGYLPMESFVPKASGNDNIARTIGFLKKDICSAQIDNFEIINVAKPNIPLVINMRSSLDATTHSAFATNLNTPFYTPPQFIDEFYSAQTKIELKIYDLQGNIVFQASKQVNIQADKSVDVSFSWTPIRAGDYRAVISTDVTDDQCASSKPQQSTKDFEVLSQEPISSCYTILNNLKTSNDKPSVDEKLTISANKISNLADATGALSPVSTKVSALIFRENKVVHSQTLNLAANPDEKTPKSFSFDFTPTDFGLYTISLNGISDDAQCKTLTNIDDTITQTFFVQKPSAATLFIKEIPGKEVNENQHLEFNIETQYNGNLKLKYRVAVPDDVGVFNFDPFKQTFTLRPNFDAVDHPATNLLQVAKNLVSSVLGLPLFRDIKVIFFVTDGVVSAKREATIRIFDVNRDPILQSIADKTLEVGQTITIIPVATDADNDKIRFTFTAPLDAQGTWTPTNADIRTHQVTVRAFDAFGGVDATSFSITVVPKIGVNHPPVLSKIRDKTVQEENLLEFTLKATDADGDVLTFFAQNLPLGATLNPLTGKFSWTPTHAQIGVHFVTFGVTDNLAQDTQLVKITVTPKGVVPPTPPKLIEKKSHKLDIVSLIIIDDTLRPPQNLEAFVYVKNTGSEKQKNVILTLTIPSLGIVQQRQFDLVVKQEELVIFDIEMPTGISKGNYALYVSAYDKTSSVVRAGEFYVL